ncbi:unnamed protein product [Boreogadus saida]
MTHKRLLRWMDGHMQITHLYHRISFGSQKEMRMGSFYQIHSYLQRSFRYLKVGLRIAFSFTWRCALSTHLRPLPPTPAERLLLPLHSGAPLREHSTGRGSKLSLFPETYVQLKQPCKNSN